MAYVAAASFGPAARADQYETGGALAGVTLPLYPTQHGEPPGYPGCTANGEQASPLAPQPKGSSEAAKVKSSARHAPTPTHEGTKLDRRSNRAPPAAETPRPFTCQGQAPERLLHPASVEHWRSYWLKYCPARCSFDRQSLLRNFPAAELAGVPPGAVESYAEPVYWVPRHGPAVNTGYRNKPVPVVRCGAGGPVLKLDFGTLPIGMYAVRVIGAVETKELREIRKPLYLRVTIARASGGASRVYRVRIPYVDEFYAVAELFFHAPPSISVRAWSRSMRRKGLFNALSARRMSEAKWRG